MSANNPVFSNLPEDRRYTAGITGAGAADPTKRHGSGITVTWQATGIYRYTFGRHPGYFKGFDPAFGADTPSAVKGYTCTRGVFVAATSTASAYIDLYVWNSSFAAADLQVLQYLDCEFEFTETSVA